MRFRFASIGGFYSTSPSTLLLCASAASAFKNFFGCGSAALGPCVLKSFSAYAASGAPVSRPGKRRFGIHWASEHSAT
ncbi:hypothetical protein CfE428DRAFT_2521 [Chthoniobacter flavus Ellin428]|uniref:Secreted protein n=1 Tax=Chthoniobacter flavus Ellin428 TaxID=497964 RepID=B4D0S0_9BACT|nr:hypothetical protein CfE428DRAFT_2521 [Chthoniobacter flavus Ellin428]